MLSRDHPELGPIDQDFIHLFTSWFNKGFLELERINWQTSATVLEKLTVHESVHEIQGWDDLRRHSLKIGCVLRIFILLFLTAPIFVEVALVQGMADAIAPF